MPVSIPAHSPKGFKGVDASPFGGGAGMVMRADVLKEALIAGVVRTGGYDEENYRQQLHIVCPAPRGKTWDQPMAQEFAQNYLAIDSKKDLVFICGRYEGIDERFMEKYIDQFISLGDYILTGGELAVMTILDSAMRFSPGVLGNKCSAHDESFFNNKLEYALYTRPKVFDGVNAPEELTGGNHKKIIKFKLQSSLEVTHKYRPDLEK
ncbi:MAG: tRNA (guanosine(37)-N1)-methyltransferase TrmD [Halobacteriovoraceae bacterium]|nr:tRNA (guanosine(37)-N1)-methyltransferase TrmD [Halobacteriovoraceae bacterium]